MIPKRLFLNWFYHLGMCLRWESTTLQWSKKTKSTQMNDRFVCHEEVVARDGLITRSVRLIQREKFSTMFCYQETKFDYRLVLFELTFPFNFIVKKFDVPLMIIRFCWKMCKRRIFKLLPNGIKCHKGQNVFQTVCCCHLFTLLPLSS